MAFAPLLRGRLAVRARTQFALLLLSAAGAAGVARRDEVPHGLLACNEACEPRFASTPTFLLLRGGEGKERASGSAEPRSKGKKRLRERDMERRRAETSASTAAQKPQRPQIKTAADRNYGPEEGERGRSEHSSEEHGGKTGAAGGASAFDTNFVDQAYEFLGGDSMPPAPDSDFQVSRIEDMVEETSFPPNSIFKGMKRAAGKPSANEAFHEEDDSADASDSSGEPTVDFEIFDPVAGDAPGIEPLLLRFLGEAGFPSLALADEIVSFGAEAGGVLKVAGQDDIFGVFSAIPLGARPTGECEWRAAILAFMRAYAPESARALLEELFEAGKGGTNGRTAALVISERAVGVPQSLATPLASSLFSELEWARQEKGAKGSKWAVSHFLSLCRVNRARCESGEPVDSAGDGTENGTNKEGMNEKSAKRKAGGDTGGRRGGDSDGASSRNEEGQDGWVYQRVEGRAFAESADIRFQVELSGTSLEVPQIHFLEVSLVPARAIETVRKRTLALAGDEALEGARDDAGTYHWEDGRFE